MYWRTIAPPIRPSPRARILPGMTYDRSLRYFTSRHGGYFSPQSGTRACSLRLVQRRPPELPDRGRPACSVSERRRRCASHQPHRQRRRPGRERCRGSNGWPAPATTAIYPGQSKTGLGYNLGSPRVPAPPPRMFIGSHLSAGQRLTHRQFRAGNACATCAGALHRPPGAAGESAEVAVSRSDRQMVAKSPPAGIFRPEQEKMLSITKRIALAAQALLAPYLVTISAGRFESPQTLV